MSTSNITNIENVSPDPMIPIVEVTFQTHRGDERTYRYVGVAAIQIMQGEDPAEFSGVEV